MDLRTALESAFSDEERAELFAIKEGFINQNYDIILEPTEKQKSIKDHYPLHLVVLKKD